MRFWGYVWVGFSGLIKLAMAGITVDNETRKVVICAETPWLWDEKDGPFQKSLEINISSLSGPVTSINTI